MLALKITNIKDFMSKLLIGTSFDALWVTETSVTTFCTFSIDGTLHPEFYETEQQEALQTSHRKQILWKEIKPFCYSMIKGRQTPLHLKIIFQLSLENTQHLLKNAGLAISPDDIAGMYLNFQYNVNQLLCTTGLSLRIFTMDKTLEQLWDHSVLAFFNKKEITFEQA